MADRKARLAISLKAKYDDAIAAGEIGMAKLVELQAEMNGIDLADVKELRTADKPDVIPSTFGTPKGPAGVPDQIVERQRLMEEMKADENLGNWWESRPGNPDYAVGTPFFPIPGSANEGGQMVRDWAGDIYEALPSAKEIFVDPYTPGSGSLVDPSKYGTLPEPIREFGAGLAGKDAPAPLPMPEGGTYRFIGPMPAEPDELEAALTTGPSTRAPVGPRPAPEAVPSLPPQVRPQARPAAVPAAAGPTTPELDITLPAPAGTPQDESAQRLVEELRSGDEDKGGRGISRMSFGSGIRDNILGLFADKNDEEAMNRLSRSFAAGGAAILQADGRRGWQYALGAGIEAGIADYDNQHEAGLEEEATRQRMALAQEEMEQRRRREGRDESEAAFQRSLDIINAQKSGIVFDENGLPIGYSAEEAAKYAPANPYEDWGASGGDKMKAFDIWSNPNNFRSEEERAAFARMWGLDDEDIFGAAVAE